MVRSTISTVIPKKLQLPNMLLHQEGDCQGHSPSWNRPAEGLEPLVYTLSFDQPLSSSACFEMEASHCHLAEGFCSPDTSPVRSPAYYDKWCLSGGCKPFRGKSGGRKTRRKTLMARIVGCLSNMSHWVAGLCRRGTLILNLNYRRWKFQLCTRTISSPSSASRQRIDKLKV